VTEVRLSAVGHPAVTGRHDKTLELTAADAITARATCVLGVAAGPLPGGLPALRGRVRLTIAAGGAAAAVDGEVNPAFASADRLVVRRSDRRDPDTFLVNASAAAADMPAELLAALRARGATVTVTAAETGTPPPVLLVLLAGVPPAPEVVRLTAQADVAVDLTGRGAAAPAVPLAAPRRHGLPREPLAGRTVAVLAADLGADVARAATALPGARVLVWPPVPGVDLLIAAGRPAAPVLHAGTLPVTATGRRELARQVAAAGVAAVLDVPAALLPPAGTAPAATVPLLQPAEQSGLCAAAVSSAALRREVEQGGGRVGSGPGLAGEVEQSRSRPASTGPASEWLAQLREDLPRHAVLLPDPAVGWGVGALLIRPGEEAGDLSGLRQAPRLVLLPPDGPRPLPVDPAELARLLRRAGSTGRDATAVLTGLGVPRKEAYRLAAGQP